MATYVTQHAVHVNRSTLRFLQTMTTVAIIGAINWGLIGFFNFNLVDAIFGGGSAEQTSSISRVIYAIVGLAGIAALFFLPSKPNESGTQSRMEGRPL